MKKCLRSGALILLLWMPLMGNTGTITTPQVIAQTTSAALSCMRWMPVGICFWLRCSLSGCSVETSLKVGHYQPDAVVSSYNELGGNPWVEIRSTLGVAQQSAANGLLGSLLPVPIDSAGNRTEGGQGNKDHRNLVFPGNRCDRPPGEFPVEHRCRYRLSLQFANHVILPVFPVGP